MEVIAECDCGGEIIVDDVVRVVQIPKSSQYVALAYSCPNCMQISRVACSRERWLDAQIVEFGWEMKNINSAQDMIDIWEMA